MRHLTVGNLKKLLDEYPDEAVVYMEPWNVYTKGKDSTSFSQRAEYIYSCIEHMSDKKALMIVGSTR